jgi:hypothetical protein
MFNQKLSEYRQEHVRPITLEFEAAAGRDAVSRSLAQKYMRALYAYKVKIENSPGSPLLAMDPTTAHDPAPRQWSAEELEWIKTQRAHVLAQVGDLLTMDEE